MVLDPEVITKRKMDLQQHLSLHKNAGLSGQAMAVNIMSRVAQSVSTVGRDLWEQFKVYDPLTLVKLGIHSNVVVNTYPLSLYVLIPLIFSYFNLVLLCFSSFKLL